MRYCEFSVCTALRLDDKIYLSERMFTDEFIGYWQWPGGEVKDKENPRNAAQRELKEETNLDLNLGRFFYLDSITGDPTTKACYVYYVDLNETEWPVRTENKSSDWRLLSYDEALKLRLMPGLAPAIQRLRKQSRSEI